MHPSRTIPTASLALLLTLPAAAQDVRFDGLRNDPLGSASLQVGANGDLLVSNLGSSGQDGVRVDLGQAEGGSLAPDVTLAPNERASFGAWLTVDGSATPVPIELTMTAVGGGDVDLRPDFSALGAQDYYIRILENGEIVYASGGNTGACRMHNAGGQLPEKVYVFQELVAGPHYPVFCGFVDGTVTPPGGGNPIHADLVEFYVDPAGSTAVEAMELRVAGPPSARVLAEELRLFGVFERGLADAHLDVQGGGLRISNIGSSGWDGVSIAGCTGGTETHLAFEEVVAVDHPNARVWLESRDRNGRTDRVLAEELLGDWRYTPDFSELGAASYTLELYRMGQLVYSQGGMSGPAFAAGKWIRIYKEVTEHADGSTTTEWCIQLGNSSASHSVEGGPTVDADMAIVRAEISQFSDRDISWIGLRASGVSGDLVLTDVDVRVPGCLGTGYCIAAVNSTGQRATMCSSGSSSVAGNDLVLTCSGLPTNQWGLLFYGPNQVQIPFGNGYRCVGGGIYRLPVQNSGAGGVLVHALDNTSPPSPDGQIQAGDVWNFQCWYRDPAAGGAAFNLSDGHWIRFTP